jgi:hypothetical protein
MTRQDDAVFALDGDRDVSHHVCPGCGREYDRVLGFLLPDGNARAVYRAALHGHDDPQRETWIEVTFDDDWSDPDQTHRVSLACRVGLFDGEIRPAAALVTAGVAYPEPGTFGRRLTRVEALASPLLEEFWEVVDWVLTHDPDVASRT